jgi:hypothetical protein
MAGFLLLHIRQRGGNPYSTPLRFTSIVRSHSSILRRSSGACGMSPALLIITSTPYSRTAASTNFFTRARSVTSVIMAIACRH